MPARLIQRLLLLVLLTVQALPAIAQNQPVSVVAEPYFVTNTEQSPNAWRVISRESLEARQPLNAMDALSGEAGLYLDRSHTFSQNGGVYLRGADREHTLILIDGIDFNDPSAQSGTFPLEFLDADNIERIEILRGPQSTLYGSRAIGGVINIVTREGQGANKVRFKGFLGNRNIRQASVGVNGELDALSYNVMVATAASDGFNPSLDEKGKEQDDGEEDGYRRDSYALKYGYRFNETVDTELIINGFEVKLDADNLPGRDGEDTNREETYEAGMAQWKLNATFFSQALNLSFRATKTMHEREVDNPADDDNPFTSDDSHYEGTNDRYDLQLRYQDEHNRLVMGYEALSEYADVDEETQILFTTAEGTFPVTSTAEYKERNKRIGRFVQWTLINESEEVYSLMSLGHRVETQQRFDAASTNSGAWAFTYKPSQSTLRLSQGSGFRAPTLFGLYDPRVGNLDLKPETSQGHEIGLEQVFNGDSWLAWIEMRQFANNVRDLITFDPVTFSLINLSESQLDGQELELGGQFLQDWHLRANHTLLKSVEVVDGKDGDPLPNRPWLMYGLKTEWTPSDWHLTLDYQFVGERQGRLDDSSSGDVLKLAPYRVVNFGTTWNYSQSWKFQLFVENLQDEVYEQVVGVRSTPRTVRLGGSYTWQ